MQWSLIHSVTLEKPSFGKACNGCGICCISVVCDLGVTLGDDMNCKALTRKPDGSFQCGMVVDPYRYMSDEDLSTWRALDRLGGGAQGEDALKACHAEALGAGLGCDADDEALQEYLQEARENEQMTLEL